MTQKTKVILSYLLIALYWIAVCFLLFGCNNYKATILRVKDADTFVLSNGTVIRLADCDAVEISQPFGIEAKRYAENILLNKQIEIREKEKDAYGRTVAQIEVNDASFSHLLVSNGYAHINPRYCRNEQLIEDYANAKRSHKGLFKNNNYVLPYKWRQETSKKRKQNENY